MARWSGILLVCAACSPSGVSDAQAQKASVALEACRVRGIGKLAECGTVEVLENPAKPEGKKIALRVVRIPAESAREQVADPLFLLAGGPGQSAVQAYGPMLPVLRRIHRVRDIVMVDQRGTGASGPLHCTLPVGLEENMVEGVLAEVARVCRRELDADLTQYSTRRAAADLDAVVAALGYDTINLFGASYGTRLALEFVRRHAGAVRSVVIDGVAPRSMRLPLSMAKDAQRAVERIFAACQQDAGCKQAYGDPATTFRDVLASFPQRVRLRDPRTAELLEVTMTRTIFVSTLRGLLYSPELTSLLPLTLAQVKRGDFQSFVAQASLLGGSAQEMMSLGLFLSVVCGEDVARISEADVVEHTARTFLGRTMMDELRGACDGWPRPQLEPDFAEPVKSDVPVLALSGDMDPVTPPAWGEAAVAHLSNGRHLVVPGASHGTVMRGCTARLMAEFIDAPGQLAELDASCLEHAALDTPAFFIDFAGPQH